ncbi:ATP-binding cassette domain-containing protein [uncultured Parolsenella sp.]|uniref:ATP-binding cassette domain-containing protein n=1 Tax=uncultured Parolsenella sp. TaxID=2083008 RepID=UPI0025D65AB4|nr:ATP-binding cassette domain-containing protein [uncultured Parolsenella sp.]
MTQIDHIEVRGARVHNLKNVDVDIPLGELVGIAGVSGSGKSSLALGVLYAEGSRRYLEALSTYTRRRISQAGKASVDDVRYVPAALALHQRPAVPGVRSTFGTSSELLNSLRLLFSRVGSHACPHCGAHVPPSLNVAAELPLVCPECGESFFGPGAEDLAFNSDGSCPACSGTGIVRTVNRAALVPDESKTIDEGAVVVWGSLMWDLMKQVCGAMGVRTDVPFCELTPAEREMVFDGPAEKRHILYKSKKTDDFAELDFTYYNAVRTVENALAKAKDEKGLKRIEKYLVEALCPECGGTRLSTAARGPLVCGINLAEATRMTLAELDEWAAGVPESLSAEMRPMAASICDSFKSTARRLLELGLGYLSLDRAGSTLSTGERQRVQLARSVRNRTTGVLYVMDEPSIGLHPANVDGLLGVMRDLIADGNSVVMVDHDTRILAAADHIIEMGPEAGAGGGCVLAQGSVAEVAQNPESLIGPYLSGGKRVAARCQASADTMFDLGRIHLESSGLHTVRPFSVDVPRGRLVAVTGVSGSGKTTLVLETLIPALAAAASGEALPAHVTVLDAEGIRRANLIDATPIGVNVRSTVATYCGVLDDLRRAYARTDVAREAGLKPGDFSYNTGSLRCPTCDGTGQISLDVQFLPDVDIACPDCRGGRYGDRATGIRRAEKGVDTAGLSLPELLALSVDEALPHVADVKRAHERLQTLHDLGLGYLTLGEATPALSGGEAQRLKLASEMGRGQEDAVFVFDEPTIGLHPRDVEVLLGVFQRLVEQDATVVVIEHDLDFIANADYVIDMGPGGGEDGGRIVACGTPGEVAANPVSVTGRYLRA